ncbi:MAG: 5-deoxy-glucuronate isomerase [Actinomycetota bacterium]|nr:5-deoxy-glucuronate isomerase [Actinomycetota bacterium]
MSELLIKANPPEPDGSIARVTPESAAWEYVGFEVLNLTDGDRANRRTDGVEACLVAVAGGFTVETGSGERFSAPGRPGPFEGAPDAVYLPPGLDYTIIPSGSEAEVGICTAPAEGRYPARELPGADIERETRGYGSLERRIYPILMADIEAESLLVCEVVTPPGHWSSYPPHKHDRDNLPEESFLEETYYHRIRPEQGFALQRVYTEERDLDEAVVVENRDTVLVPRGYHGVSAPPGYENYYLNVMAGPTREWAIHNDPDHEWLLDPEARSS